MHKALGIILLLVITLAPLTSAALSYTPYVHVEGVNKADRADYQTAADNTAGPGEDTLRYLFQGPATIGVPGISRGAWYTYNNTTIGYMEDLKINVTNLGTIVNLRYSTLDVLDKDPLLYTLITLPTQTTKPKTLEGWIIGIDLQSLRYNYHFTDFVAVTYTTPYGQDNVTVQGQYTNITNVDTKVIVDNPRLRIVKSTIKLFSLFQQDDPTTNENEQISLNLSLEVVTVFNKVAKTVRIYHRLSVEDVKLLCADNVRLTLSLSRAAILDANPECDAAYYYNGTVTINGRTSYIVLSWVNGSLADILTQDKYYADYMLAYPVPDRIAVISTSTEANIVPSYYYTPFITNRFSVVPGRVDQAFIRYEWDNSTLITADAAGKPLPNFTGLQIAYPMVVYGVYDVGPRYDGTLSVGFVNGLVTDAQIRANEDYLNDTVNFLDLNQDGIDNTNPALNIYERDLPVAWYPTDEFAYQLRTIFDPVTFSKFDDTTVEGVDFIVLPPSGAGADSAAATYMAMLRAATMIMFDVEPNGMVASIAYTYPSTKALPYLALKLTPWVAGERYGDRRAHFMTADGRALLPSEFMNVAWTNWTDDRYVLITVAGPHPNLVTYYFNDFLDIVRAMAGDLGTVIVVPSAAGKVYDITPYIGDSNYGLAVIAVTRDNYGRTALVVHGLAAQDTYWAAYYAYYNWNTIVNTYGDYTALLLEINYTSANVWAAGGGLPLAHHTMPTFDVLVAATPYSVWFP